MKKIFYLLLISILFISCVSNWFGKNKNDDNNSEEQKENIPVSSIEIPHAPAEIEEPLVRDLETEETQLSAKSNNGKTKDNNTAASNTNDYRTNTGTNDSKVPQITAAENKTNTAKTNESRQTTTKTSDNKSPASKTNETKTGTLKSDNTKSTGTVKSNDTKTTDTKTSNKPDYANLNNRKTQTGTSESNAKTPSVSNTKASNSSALNNASSSNTGSASNTDNDSYTKMTGKDEQKSKGNAEYPGFVKDDIEPQEDEMNYTEIKEADDSAVPSRSVTLKRGELLQVVYPGSGWIYLGSLSEYNNLESRGRKVGDTQTIYTLYAKDKGTQLHHFYKTDNLTGNYIDDYLEVTVLDIKGSITTSVKAPDYTGFVPKQPARPAIASTKITADEEKPKDDEIEIINANKNEIPDISQLIDEQTQNESILEQPAQINQEELSADQLLKLTREYISNKDYINANKTVNLFLTKATDKTDEGLFLKGQILEANSSLKDIKSAIATYEDLVHNYPSSAFWEDAGKRIKYLKRFYIDIY
ncbi:MAG: outer membrane protein assembly factor BamD [Treponema sp.]|nr:outer membrane protein assembly factor BamD [Treponema sp.]